MIGRVNEGTWHKSAWFNNIPEWQRHLLIVYVQYTVIEMYRLQAMGGGRQKDLRGGGHRHEQPADLHGTRRVPESGDRGGPREEKLTRRRHRRLSFPPSPASASRPPGRSREASDVRTARKQKMGLHQPQFGSFLITFLVLSQSPTAKSAISLHSAPLTASSSSRLSSTLSLLILPILLRFALRFCSAAP